jgi:hypothetical protein
MSGISVQLVDAVTKQPFKEHYKDGKTYVEVEPQVEYFIKIQRKEHNVMDGEDEIPEVIAVSEVDGVYLGYSSPWTFEEPGYNGCLNSFKNGIETMTALRFGTPSVSDNNAKPINVSAGMVGTISVNIYEAIEAGLLEDYSEFSSANLSSQIEAPLADGKQHKARYALRLVGMRNPNNALVSTWAMTMVITLRQSPSIMAQPWVLFMPESSPGHPSGSRLAWRLQLLEKLTLNLPVFNLQLSETKTWLYLE